MNVLRMARAACATGTLLLVISCGGGGGGGGGGGNGGTPPTPPPSSGNPPAPTPDPPAGTPTGPLPTFAVSSGPITFTAPIPNHTPDSQRITVAFGGAVPGKLYVLATVSDGTIVGASVTDTSQAGQPSVDVFAVPAGASSLLRGTYTSVITLTACVNDETCQTNQLPGSPQTVNVTYTVRSEVQGDLIGPRVIPAGASGAVYLRGRGLSQASQVNFGTTAATAVRPSQLDGETEVLATYPVLAPGTYPVSINGGAIPFTASLVVIAPPVYPATQLVYPDTPREIGGLIYDAQRQALYVVARYMDSQSNKLFKYQFSGSAWLPPVAATIPDLQDVALSADGSKLLLLANTSLTEFDVASFTQLGNYLPDDALVRAGTAYMQNLAVANDGYAIVTTGGANPSNTLLYSDLAHTFFTINSSNGNLFGAQVDPQIYFGNPGVSADGSLVAISQDQRTAATLPPLFTRPFLYLYGAVNQQRPSYFGSPSSPFTDKDRSQGPRSSRTVVNNIPGTLAGTRIIVNGASTTVIGGDFSSRGMLPDTTRSAAIKPDATRVYTFDAPAGTDSGQLRSYDISTRLLTTQTYTPIIGVGIPMSPGAGTGAVVMAITPDGGTLFVAGTSGVFVQPTPP